ncbi:MAG: FAD-dependent oxidoreductase [Spirochaetaceae bacterium]|jgi:NADPH-dependent 2,4-dienoyl-CoA reductase/sulfur reductase-like enzyme/rhodanese-related sulfurtransferase|nr:FAD-dependent oxidoreductase [Spirochaetaceae bacterium]
MKYVIVGGSAAGPKTASKIRRLDQHSQVTIIQKGKYLSMASCGYPYFVGGTFDDPNALISTPTGVPRDSSYFSKVKDIDARVETEAIAIDRENKKQTIKNLTTGEEETISYDKLVLTTGASPIRPPIEGIDLQGVQHLHSMEDAIALKKVAKDPSAKVVIVGGGLIGIETCEALQLAGLDITLVEMQNQILPFLDWEMAKLVQNYMELKGINFKMGAALKRFIGEGGKLNSVELNNGEIIPCTHALFSIGVRPNVALAAKAGLKLGDFRGIQVNRFMQTSDPDIYAAGDCVEITNLITKNKQPWPMGDAANLQGRVVAQNVVLGNIEEYEGMVGTGICKVFDFNAGSTGLSEKMAREEGYNNVLTSIHAAPDKPGFMGALPMVIKLLADKSTGRFLGLQAVGLGDVSKRVAIAAMALHGRMSIADMVNLDLPYAPPFSSAIDNLITAVHVLENKWRGLMTGISAIELKERLDKGEKPFILDVRGRGEFEAMRLGIGETLIPLGQIRQREEELPKDKTTEIITYCKISLRGYEAACCLKAKGYSNVKVLEGGILAWPFKREKRFTHSLYWWIMKPPVD